MKKLFLVLVLALSLVSFSEEQNSYIEFENRGYNPVTITICYNDYNGWEPVGTMHIPGGSSKSIYIGRSMISSYGYSKRGERGVTGCYSSTTVIY